eukprot:GHVT01084311.1.p1 GENE.GHVT01084311.1~~GHVT01084311.1.p1  ORF type:complete len:111 (+),score=3.62 GHVT01084311.1:1297-1629(+)
MAAAAELARSFKCRSARDRSSRGVADDSRRPNELEKNEESEQPKLKTMAAAKFSQANLKHLSNISEGIHFSHFLRTDTRYYFKTTVCTSNQNRNVPKMGTVIMAIEIEQI